LRSFLKNLDSIIDNFHERVTEALLLAEFPKHIVPTDDDVSGEKNLADGFGTFLEFAAFHQKSLCKRLGLLGSVYFFHFILFLFFLVEG